jgi:hypothetical protein
MLRIIAILFLLTLSNCKWFTNAGTPYFMGTNFKIPQGTPTFQQGWKDGCSSSLYSRGNVFYRTRYGYRYDPKMIGNTEYRFGHARGYTWCFQQVLAGTSGPVGSPDRLLNPYGYDSTYNAASTEAAWDGFFGGGSIGQNTNTASSSAGGFDGIVNIFTRGSEGNAAGGVFSANPLWAGGSSGQFFGQ